MWVFTQHGFISIVRSREDPKVLMVRARDRKSLEQFVEVAHRHPVAEEPLTILETKYTDYSYRVICSPQVVADYLASEAVQIDYSNFKDRVTKTRGSKWHDVLMSIWGKALGLRDRERYSDRPSALTFPTIAYCEGRTKKKGLCWHPPRIGFKTCWQHADQ